MQTVSPNHLLNQWAEVVHQRDGALGFSSETTLGLVTKGIPLDSGYGPRLPCDVRIRGLSAFNRVETVLRELGPKYRVACLLEFGVLRPGGHHLKFQGDRAELLGVTLPNSECPGSTKGV